jgi:pyruvate formate lyase activating enzyme
MKIASYTRQSFIDWPGKTAAVIFTRGCNFRCGYCHNPGLVLPHLYAGQPNIDESGVINFLRERTNWLDGVVISGGEPTLQPDLEEFIQTLKEMGFPVKLDTNGSRPQVLEELLEKELLDYIAMDIKTLVNRKNYTQVTGINNADLIVQIKESIDIIRQSGVAYQFRTTVLPQHHTPYIINRLNNQFSCENYILQEYREGETVDTISYQH